MKNIYSYCVLKYHHSQVLGEILNLGLIIYFNPMNYLRCVFPKSLDKFKLIYPTFPEKIIEAYIDSFRERTKELNTDADILFRYKTGKSLKPLIETEFLASDSSRLQFSDYKTSLLYSKDVDSVLKSLSETYFPDTPVDVNDVQTKKIQKTKDDWIKPDVKNKIAKMDRNEVFLPRQDELSFLNELS